MQGCDGVDTPRGILEDIEDEMADNSDDDEILKNEKISNFKE